MHAIRLTVGLVVLAVSQIAAAIGPIVHIPVMPKPCCAALGKSGVLHPTVTIFPDSVITYEPSTGLYTRSPRFAGTLLGTNREHETLRELLKQQRTVVVPTQAVDPAFMKQYRGSVVLTEELVTPLLKEFK